MACPYGRTGKISTVNIALFGGSFDPIHSGHLAAARAAMRRFRLDRILFIPTGNPPHKRRDHLTAYAERLAMVALACAGEERFVPSALEAPTPEGTPHYSVNTLRRVRRSLRAGDRLFFLLGADSFLDLPHWKDFDRLIRLAEFIVVSRPGIDAEAIRRQAHGCDRDPMRPAPSGAKPPATVHLLLGVDARVASRDIRQTVLARRSLRGLVPPLVEEYILKEGLYRPRSAGRPAPR